MSKASTTTSSKSVATSMKPRNAWATSKRSKVYDCYGALDSIAIIWRCLGLFPISITEPAGIRKYGLSKFYSAHSILFFVFCCGNFFYAMFHSARVMRSHIPMVSITLFIRAIVSLLCLVINTVWRIFRSKQLMESINKMAEQEIILDKMNSRFNYESCTRIVRAYVWTTFLIISSFVVYDFYASIRVSISWFAWWIPLVAQVMDLTIFVCLVGWLGLKFRSMNDKLRIVVTRANTSSPKVIITSDVCAENLRILSKVHYNLCAVGKGINSIFDWDVLINVATAFIILSTTLYYIFWEVQRDAKTNMKRICLYIQWEFIQSAPIIVVVIACNWTSRQAIYAGKLIHEIRVEITDCRLYGIVKSFSLQLHHQKLEFTAGGFFPLNSTLLQSMIGNITTYLVILIQFHPTLYDD